MFLINHSKTNKTITATMLYFCREHRTDNASRLSKFSKHCNFSLTEVVGV